jgi:hypothetical protein
MDAQAKILHRLAARKAVQRLESIKNERISGSDSG